MANGGRINFQVGFNVDKSGLNQLKSSLQELQKVKLGDFSGQRKQLREVQETARQVQQALTNAFNPKLGSLNVAAFNKQLQGMGLTTKQIQSDLAQFGVKGQIAFSQLTRSVLTTNLQLKQTNSIVSRMGTTMMNTIKWTFASSMIQQFTNGIRQAFQYVQALDASLTDIRIVTGDSTEQMRQFAQQANNAAQALGRSTMDYTKAALTFYQQGLDDQSVAARTQATLQAQNITGAGDEMADYLTAVWNGYKVANEQAQLYVDRLAAVADSSASNMAQLATAMSKVAATANAMGVDVDQLNAQIATIIATTRQAPQTVGNALKTIFARINDIQAGTQDAQVSLGHYTGTMAELGINVLDASGHLRDTGQVMEEIGGKWATMSREQQIYLARTMAGQRQYNNLIALFDNWGRYTELVNVSMDSQGTLMEKNARYMDSLGAKMQQLGAAGEKVKDSLINEEDMKGLISGATNVVNILGSFIQSIGGARGALLSFGSIAISVFSGVISKEINNAIVNLQNFRNNAEILKQDILNTETYKQAGADSQAVQVVTRKMQEIQQYYSVMDAASINTQKNLIDELGLVEQQKTQLQAAEKEVEGLAEKFGIAATQSKDLFTPGTDAAHEFNASLGTLSDNAANIKQLFSRFQDGKATIEQVTQSFEQFKNSYSNINKQKAEQLQQAFDKMIADPSKMGAFQQRLGAAYTDAKQKVSQYGDLVNNAAQKEGELNTRTQQLGGIIDSNKDKFAQAYNVKFFTDMIGAAGRFASGLNMIVNLTRVWRNENISTGEKLLQTFTNFGFMIPMMASSIGTIIAKFSQLGKISLVEQERARAAERIAIAKGIQAAEEKAITKQKALQAFYEKTDFSEATDQEMVVFNAQELALKRQAEAAREVADATREAGNAQLEKLAADTSEAGGAMEGAGANNLFAASLRKVARDAKAAWTALLPYLPAIIGIAAVVGTVVAAGYGLYKMWNQASEAAATAAENAANAKKKYEQVKQAYEDLKSSFEKYDSIQNSLDDLTRGTQEWRDALRQANDVVLELLSTYPQLAAQVERNAEGRLVLSQQGRQDLLDYQNQQMIAARGASIIASIEARDAQALATAAGIGHEAYGMGRVDEYGNIDYTGSPQLIASIAKAYVEGASNAELAQLSGLPLEEIEELLAENRDQLTSLGQTLLANQDATRLNYQTLASQSLTEESSYRALSESEQNVADAILGLDLEEQVGQITRSLEVAQAGISRFTSGGSQTMQQLLTRYINATGAQGARWQSNAVTSENGQLIFHLVDANGNELDPTQTLFNETIAAAEALKEVQSNSLQEIREMLNAINNLQNQTAAQGVRRLLTSQDFSTMTSGQLASLGTRENMAPGMQEFFSDERAQQAGYADGDAFALAFYNAVEDSQQRFEHIADGYSGIVKTSIEQILENGDFTLGAAQNFATVIQQAFLHGGEQGLGDLLAFLDDLDSDDLQAISSLLGDIDWSSPDAVYQLRSGMEDLGIQLNQNTIPLFEEFAAWIENSANAAINALDPLGRLKNLFNSFAELKDLSPGDVIDDKLYQRLLGISDEFESLFIEAADGHTFIGSQQALYNILNNQTDYLIDNFHRAEQAANRLLEHNVAEKFEQVNLGQSGQQISSNDLTALQSLGSNEAFQGGLTAINVSQDAWNQEIQYLVDRQGQAYETLSQQERQYYDERRDRIASWLSEIAELQARAENGGFTDQILQQNIASQAFSTQNAISQLRRYYNQGKIDAQMYSQVRDAAVEREVERLDTTRQAYDSLYDDIWDYLQKTSVAFTELGTDAERSVEVDQLITEIYDLGSALDQLSEMSTEDFSLVQQGLEDLSEGFSINSSQASQALGNLQGILQNIFNTQIDTAFIQQHFDLIQRLAYGDISALDDLQLALAQDYVADIQANTDDASVLSALNEIQNLLNDFPIQDLQVGMTLEDSQYAQALVDAALMAGMTADDINQLLGRIGFEPQVTSQWIPFDELSEGYNRYESTYHYVAPDGTKQNIPVSVEQYNNARGAGGIQIPIINNKRIKYNPRSSIASMARPKYSGVQRPSGGGGGGKSSGSTAKPSVQKPSQDTRDPYHDINRLLDKQKEKLDDIQKQDKKLVNRDRLANINAQNKALEEQANLLENKLAIAESEQIRLRNQLLADTNGYAQFGANGQITNFNQMLANAEKQYNNYIAYYNTLSKQQQDAEKDRLDLEKERYQRVKKTADEYEKTLDLQRDLLEQINEAQEKIYQNMIKQSQIRVDLAVDTGDLEREYLDFENKFIKKLDKDDFLGNAKANVKELMSYFHSDQIKKRNEEINSLNAIIQRIEKHGGGAYVDPQTGYNLAAAQERLNELFKDQTKALQEIDSLVEDIQKQYLDSLKDAKDKMDDQIDQYERINDLLDHSAKLAQLIYGDKAYASLEKYYNLQQDNDERALNNLRMQQQYWQSQLNNEVVGSDAWLQIKKNLDDITDDINDKLQDIIDRLADQWEARVKKITNQMENGLTGGRGLSFLDEQWDYVNQYDDNFLDTLESKFGIQQVQTLYQEALDSVSGDPKSQQKLNDLMQKQLKLLREKDKLTQYDIERAKAALEVEKARLALENQRDNKSKMRLRRDSQGNYTYQYVADEQKLSDLQAALNDAQANLYNMDKEHYKENLDEFYGAFKDYKEKMVALAQQLRQANAAGDKEEEERIKARMALLDESFTNFFDGLTEDNRYSLQYLAESFGDGMGFDKETQQAEGFFDIMKENIPQVALDIQNLIDNISSQGGIMSAMQEFREGLQASNTQYFADLNKYMTEAGTSAQTVMQVTDDYGNALDTAVEKAKQFLPYYDKMIVDSIEAVEGIRDVIEQIEELLDEKLDDNELVKSLREAFNQLEALNRYFNPETKERSGKVTAQNLDVVERNIDTTENGAGVITAQDWRNYLNNQSTSQPITLANINAIGQLDADTLNSLSNEDVLLNVIGTIKYLTDSMGAMVNQQIGSMIKEASSYIGNIENVEKLDQNVHIEANFPNVIQAEEIKAAFNNLVNMAAQAAYKPNTT